LYGRGSADDKGAIALHAAAVRAHGDRLPVGITVFVEGEEETGSQHLAELIERERELMSADVIIVTDGDNWRVDEPSLTITLRGLVDCVVEVRTIPHAVHSGMYGGLFPDALTALSQVLASLVHGNGQPALPGLVSRDPGELGFDADGPLRDLKTHVWSSPAISVLAIDGPRIAETTNQIVPTAKAKISLRIAPGDDPDRALNLLLENLQADLGQDATLRVTPGVRVPAFEVKPHGPVYDACRAAFEEAWGRPLVMIGSGSSVPFAAIFAAAYPQAAVLMTGLADSDCRAHGPNEGLDLELLRKAAVAEVFLLERLADA
jgi:acetylornithine deacetylase/succinyl-diaminopimelate desuccinylase-like protein